jgi:alkaline phosphatase
LPSTAAYISRDAALTSHRTSAAVRTYNGGIGVDEDASPLGTVLEAAKAQGFTTGMVVTSRITHASPAAFASHTYDRDLEDRIAEQLIGGTPLGHTVDLLLGGGSCWFQPNTTTGSCREDGEDVFADAAANGYKVFQDRAGFDALGGGHNVTLPILGLFTPSHMSYEVDRNATKEPSLAGASA